MRNRIIAAVFGLAVLGGTVTPVVITAMAPAIPVASAPATHYAG